MTELLDKMRSENRIKRMRMGQDVPEWATIPSMPEIRIALVPLLEVEAQASLVAAANVEAPDNPLGISVRARTAMQYDVWQASRHIEDPEQYVWPTVEEMIDMLEPDDIEALNDQLTVLMDYASPAIEGLTEADLAELKNAFVLIDWSALTGRRWSALRLCLSHLLPELLTASQPSTTSTPSSTTRSENDEST